jgi:hypothetical protein
MNFVDWYKNLLIKQYWDRPKASAEIALKAGMYEGIFNFLSRFPDEFDIDQAYGHRLDLIGKIVGFNRSVPFAEPGFFFGFSENPEAGTFGDLFQVILNAAPFYDLFGSEYTSLQLQDSVYKTFLHGKIAKNNCSPYLADDIGIPMQQAAMIIFDGYGHIIDNYDMTLELVVSFDFNVNHLRGIINTDLLPRPHGVRYRRIIQYEQHGTFGFSDNPRSAGFANLFDLANEPGGSFAEEVII